mgnify:CR=1 FL=1
METKPQEPAIASGPEKIDAIMKRVMVQLRSDLKPFRKPLQSGPVPTRIMVTFVVESFSGTSGSNKKTGLIRKISERID